MKRTALILALGLVAGLFQAQSAEAQVIVRAPVGSAYCPPQRSYYSPPQRLYYGSHTRPTRTAYDPYAFARARAHQAAITKREMDARYQARMQQLNAGATGFIITPWGVRGVRPLSGPVVIGYSF